MNSGEDFEDISDDSDFEAISDDDSSIPAQNVHATKGKTVPRPGKKRKTRKREAIAGRANALLTRIDLVEVEKSDAATAFLKESLGKQALFASMDETQLAQFVLCMAREQLQPGSTLIKQVKS